MSLPQRYELKTLKNEMRKDLERLNRMIGLDDLKRRYKILFSTVIVYILLTVLTYIWLYFQYHLWQTLIVPAISFFCLLSLPVIYFFLNNNKVNLAGSLFFLTSGLLLGCHIAVWVDFTLLIILSGVLVLFLIAQVVLRSKKTLGIGFCLFYISVVGFVDKYIYLPRLTDANVPWVKEFMLVINSLFILALTAQVIMEIRFRSIQTRLMFTLVLFVLFPLLFIGFISNTLNAQNYQNQTFRQLNTIILLKSEQITTWQNGLLAGISAIVPSTSSVSQIEYFFEANRNSTDINGYSFVDEINKSFRSLVDDTEMFTEIFLMDPQWKIYLSTNPNHQSKVESSRIYFQSDLENSHFSPLFIDPETRMITQVLILPIVNNSGDIVAIMGGKVDLSSLTAILSQELALGETNELFIVLPNRRLLITNNFDANKDENTLASSSGIDKALGQINGQGIYQGHHGYPVIGVYRWLPDLQVALIAEQSQNEALNAISQVGLVTVVLMVIGIFAAFSVGLVITRRIVNPLVDLSNTARIIASGDLSLNAEIHQDDELGELSRAFNALTIQLRNLVTGLELRVLERTGDLERQTEQLRQAVDIAREASAFKDVDVVINRTVTLIAEKFRYDFVGLYLVDERKEFVILSSVSGQISLDWLEEKRKIRVGSYDPVGISAHTGESRIVNDASIGYNSVYLPNIQSRMVLPLKVGQQVVGVLDIQSVEMDKLNDEILAIIQVVADQIAIAYDSARIFQRMSMALKEFELLTGKYTKASWAAAKNEFIHHSGYVFDGTSVHPINENQESRGDIGRNNFHFPLVIREDLIGSLDIKFEGDVSDPVYLESLKEISERLTLLLENTRLVMEARNIASREQQINQITAKIRNSTNMDAILRNAVEELGKAFGSSKTYIQLGLLQNYDVDISGEEEMDEI